MASPQNSMDNLGWKHMFVHPNDPYALLAQGMNDNQWIQIILDQRKYWALIKPFHGLEWVRIKYQHEYLSTSASTSTRRNHVSG